jgi:poly(ADP-ribose) glycohydrolase ARH3
MASGAGTSSDDPMSEARAVAAASMTEKILGAMVGCGLGDAIGEMAFGGYDEAGLRAAGAAGDRLIYTDDTAMMLALADSLVTLGRLDPQHLGETFRAHFRREPWRGYGPGPPRLFAMVAAERLPYGAAARRLYGGQGSFGNGAAMRTAPIGCVYRDAAVVYERASLAASVTHAHRIGRDGAAVQAIAVSQAARLDPRGDFSAQAFCRGLVDAARTDEIRQKLTLMARLVADGAPPGAAGDRIGRSIAVHESMPFALYAFLSHPKSFEDCLFCAILDGGDRDTLGAMAGALSGAYLGVAALPAGWRGKLENRAQIEELACSLAAMAE